ncbi:MAG: hypothetical protein HC810_00905 [Acaryochloridaceae cyanobacterium RL_2_7]|nr:hypothetical protein [Acaryochloridaceae cyanobacterium RL_2_7]
MEICQTFSQVGRDFNLTSWRELAETAEAAVMIETNALNSLAEPFIQNFKSARDTLLENHNAVVTPSQTLLSLLPQMEEPPQATDDWLSLFDEDAPQEK